MFFVIFLKNNVLIKEFLVKKGIEVIDMIKKSVLEDNTMKSAINYKWVKRIPG